MRPLRFVVSAIVLLTAPAQAQVVAPPPKGIILPNYDMVRIGQTEAIESGAVVARASGPLANVYNPAGLAASDKTEINGSSTGYQLVHLGLEGIGQDVSSSRLANLGGFLGAVFANPVIKSKSWRLGFSIYSPLGWEPGTLSGAAAALASGQQLDFDYRTQVRLKATIPAVSAGFSLSKTVRVGVGLQVPIINILQQQQTGSMVYDATTGAAITRAFAVDGTTWTVRANVGAQWDISKAVSVGMRLSTPTARLWGSSYYGDQQLYGLDDGFVTTQFRDPSARLEYKLPLEISGGGAVKLGKVTVEGDVKYYGSLGTWDMYSSDSTGLVLSQQAGSLPVTETVTLEPVTMQYNSVVNVAVGASVPITARMDLHLGFNTDQSPLPNTEEMFRKVSLWGVTAGVSFRAERLSGALGLGLQTGSSPETSIVIQPVEVNTKLSVKTFQLMYSIAYSF